MLNIDNSPTKMEWDTQYSSGEWNYLANLDELGRYSIIIGYINQYHSTGNILDVGCGEGLLAERLKSSPFKSYLGIDLSSSAIDLAKKSNNDERVSFSCADAGHFESDSKFDVIVLNEVLYYFENPIQTLDRYLSLLNSEGILILSIFREPGANEYCLTQIKKRDIWGDVCTVTNLNNLTWDVFLTKNG